MTLATDGSNPAGREEDPPWGFPETRGGQIPPVRPRRRPFSAENFLPPPRPPVLQGTIVIKRNLFFVVSDVRAVWA